MRNQLIGAAAALVASVGLANAAALTGGEPALVDGGSVLSASGQLTGLNETGNITVLYAVRGIAQGTCSPPGGGINPAFPQYVTAGGSQALHVNDVVLGQVDFSVTSNLPETPMFNSPACLNPAARYDITNVAFGDAVLQVRQPFLTEVLNIACTISPPSTNGNVGAGAVNCVPVP